MVRPPLDVPRPGVRGRPPAVYKLGELGATLLQTNGHPHARPCGLKDATAVAHAQATLDIRLAALDADLVVETEQELHYGEGKSLRPDNLIILPSGVPALLEVEQAVGWHHLRRVAASVRNKVDFFSSEVGREYSSTVRVIVNLPKGRKWDQTVRVWEQATTVLAEEHNGQLPFRILAMPLKFMERPDWNEPPHHEQWKSLFGPAQISDFGSVETPADRKLAPAKQARLTPRRTTQLPVPLRRHSARDDQLILLAFWQVFKEQAPALLKAHPRPDPTFFDVMHIVYAASHDTHADLFTQAALPHASLYLLRKYLEMHKPLREALGKALTRGSSSVKWSVPTILHRM